jgi:hypothetical protein
VAEVAIVIVLEQVGAQGDEANVAVAPEGSPEAENDTG